MWIASVLARKHVGLPGFRQLAAQPMNFTFLVQGVAGGIGSRSTEPREHPMRLFERLGPRPGELHDFGSMHEARAGKRHQLRLSVAPRAEPGSPFARAIERVAPLPVR